MREAGSVTGVIAARGYAGGPSSLMREGRQRASRLGIEFDSTRIPRLPPTSAHGRPLRFENRSLTRRAEAARNRRTAQEAYQAYALMESDHEHTCRSRRSKPGTAGPSRSISEPSKPASRARGRPATTPSSERLQIVGEELCEALDLRAGQKSARRRGRQRKCVLAAARRWCDVVSTDYVGHCSTAAASGRTPRGYNRVPGGRCRGLPFADESFDAVVSTFGVMFTPDQERAANELIRVCKPGGKIGLANWTPDGFIGQLFKIIGKHTPAPFRHSVTGPVGNADANCRAIRRPRDVNQGCATQLRLPLPLARSFARNLQDLLRACAQDLRRPGSPGAGRVGRRPPGARRHFQPIG